MNIEDYLSQALQRLEAIYLDMQAATGPLLYRDFGPYRQFRHENTTESLVCYLKGVKAVSTLNACVVLLRQGFAQEVGALCRMVDDFCNEIFFLLVPQGEEGFSQDQIRFVENFFQEEFDTREDTEALPAMREWAVKLTAKPKYVVSSTRKDFPWTNSHHVAGDRRTGVQRLKDATPGGVLLGSGKLATALDRLDLIDEYRLLVHPRIAGHGPTLYEGGLPGTRRLELISAQPLGSGAVAMHYRRAR